MFEMAARCVRFFPLISALQGMLSAFPGRQRRPCNTEADRRGRHRRNLCLALRTFFGRLICLAFWFSSFFTRPRQPGLISSSRISPVTGSRPRGANRFFANIDRATNTLTLLGQLFLTGKLLKWLGLTPTLIIMPTLSLIGFAVIGISPLLAILAVFQVLRRATKFAFMRPAREVLFTVLRREDKYKAKSVIDTFVYRVGDQVGAWSYRGLTALGLGFRGISFVTVPVIAVWLALSVWLGRRQRAARRPKGRPKFIAWRHAGSGVKSLIISLWRSRKGQQPEIFRSAQDDSPGEGRKRDCARPRPARVVRTKTKRRQNNGNTNWIGGMGRHAQRGQGNDETRQRRIRWALFFLIPL